MFRRSIELAILVLVAIAFAPTGAYAEVDFGPPKTYAVGTNPVAVVVGDFNGDGKTDLAVANAGSGNDHSIFLSLSISLGIVEKARAVDFGAPTTYPVGTSLLSGNGNGTFLGLGGGQFRAKLRGLYNQEIIRKCSRQERGGWW